MEALDKRDNNSFGSGYVSNINYSTSYSQMLQHKGVHLSQKSSHSMMKHMFGYPCTSLAVNQHAVNVHSICSGSQDHLGWAFPVANQVALEAISCPLAAAAGLLAEQDAEAVLAASAA